MAPNFGYRIGDLTETTTVADADNIEISRAGSAGSFKMQVVNFLKSVVPALGRTVASLAAYLLNNSVANAKDFGAKGDDATDDSAAISAALSSLNRTYGGTVLIPPGATYRITSPIVIPMDFASSARVEILAYGSRIRAVGAISAFQRRPTDQTQANTYVSMKVVIRGAHVTGDGTTSGQTAFEIGATYGAILEDCYAENVDWGFDIQFGLAASVRNCFATNCGTHHFVARIGAWTGATNNNSASNQAVFDGCRAYCKTGSTDAFYVFASDGVHLRGCVSEGANPVYGVNVDDNSSTVVKSFRATILHSENQPTGAVIRPKMAGSLVDIDGLQHFTAQVLIDGSTTGGATLIRLRSMHSIPSGATFNAGVAVGGCAWHFDYVGQDAADLTTSAFWVGGIIPLGLRQDKGSVAETNSTIPAIAGNGVVIAAKDATRSIYTLGKFQPLGTTGTYDIGMTTQDYRNAYVRGLRVGGPNGTLLTQVTAYAISLSPASVAAQSVAEQTFTCTGVTTADKIIVTPAVFMNGVGLAGARVSAADTIVIRFVNPTAGALTPNAAQTYIVLAFRS